MKKMLTMVVALVAFVAIFGGCTTASKAPENVIGEEAAKTIALENAGVEASEVKFVRCNLEFDDGIWKYDIEFRQGKTEYDAEIKADDGYIIDFETDYNG